MENLIKHIELDFMMIDFYENYVVSSIKEGVFFDFKQLEEMSVVFNDHFGDRPFVSIADRKCDYTVNPGCLLQSEFIPNLLGIAVVCHTPSSYTTAKFEEQFYKNPFQVFHNMETALEWSLSLLENSDNN